MKKSERISMIVCLAAALLSLWDDGGLLHPYKTIASVSIITELSAIMPRGIPSHGGIHYGKCLNSNSMDFEENVVIRK
jgi:hypothetical protein